MQKLLSLVKICIFSGRLWFDKGQPVEKKKKIDNLSFLWKQTGRDGCKGAADPDNIVEKC